MELDRLAAEHPSLTQAVTSVLAPLAHWTGEVHPAPGGNVWMHHHEFAEATERLAGHLEAMLLLANEGRYPSALALARTALEHHALDRLVLLADRYEEILKPDDLSLLDEWEDDWSKGVEPWTHDVVSIERTKNRKGLRIVRRGHPVVDEGGVERERISPYWVALDHHDAFVGHPEQQEATIDPFQDLGSRVDRAKRNQQLYSAFLKWASLCRNLQLCDLISDSELSRLQVHYGFLSAFTHATKSGYEVDGRPWPGAPPATHVLGELVLLYAAELAVAEIDAWNAYIAKRPQLIAQLPDELVSDADDARALTSYFWFFGGSPQPFDFFQEANRRATPLLLSGQRPDLRPADLEADDITYYGNPFERLRALHTGGSEMTTGFAYAPRWPSLIW